MICKSCGADVSEEYRLCPYCRSEIEYPATNSTQPPTIVVNNVVSNENVNVNKVGYSGFNAVSPKSKFVALILCIVLGYLGIHRFYVGKVGSGILWLFTGGFFFIGYIYDIIKIATGTFKDGNGFIISK